MKAGDKKQIGNVVIEIDEAGLFRAYLAGGSIGRTLPVGITPTGEIFVRTLSMFRSWEAAAEFVEEELSREAVSFDSLPDAE